MKARLNEPNIKDLEPNYFMLVWCGKHVENSFLKRLSRVFSVLKEVMIHLTMLITFISLFLNLYK